MEYLDILNFIIVFIKKRPTQPLKLHHTVFSENVKC